MKITLTDEQINSLVEVEINKRVYEYSTKFNNKLIKVQLQLTDALAIVNDLMSDQVIKTKKVKLTDEQFIILWNEGKSIKEIADISLYRAGFISLMRKRLLKSGKIEARIK